MPTPMRPEFDSLLDVLGEQTMTTLMQTPADQVASGTITPTSSLIPAPSAPPAAESYGEDVATYSAEVAPAEYVATPVSDPEIWQSTDPQDIQDFWHESVREQSASEHPASDHVAAQWQGEPAQAEHHWGFEPPAATPAQQGLSDDGSADVNTPSYLTEQPTYAHENEYPGNEFQAPSEPDGAQPEYPGHEYTARYTPASHAESDYAQTTYSQTEYAETAYSQPEYSERQYSQYSQYSINEEPAEVSTHYAQEPYDALESLPFHNDTDVAAPDAAQWAPAETAEHPLAEHTDAPATRYDSEPEFPTPEPAPAEAVDLGLPRQYRDQLPDQPSLTDFVAAMATVPTVSAPVDSAVVAVVGPADQVLHAAHRVALETSKGPEPRPVLVLTPSAPEFPQTVASVQQLETVVVAITADDYVQAAQLVATVQAGAVVAILDALKPDQWGELLDPISQAAPLVALDLANAAQAAQPGYALHVGVPIWHLDGVPATTLAWAGILWNRAGH